MRCRDCLLSARLSPLNVAAYHAPLPYVPKQMLSCPKDLLKIRAGQYPVLNLLKNAPPKSGQSLQRFVLPPPCPVPKTILP